MTHEKDTFIMYGKMLRGFREKMSNDQFCMLFDAILEFNETGKEASLPFGLDIAFEVVKEQMIRDNEKWHTVKEERSNSGRIGNLKRWHPEIFKKYEKGEISLDEAENIAKSHSDNSDRERSQSIANIAVTVTDTITDTITVCYTHKNFFEFFFQFENGPETVDKLREELLNERIQGQRWREGDIEDELRKFAQQWGRVLPGKKQQAWQTEKGFAWPLSLENWMKMSFQRPGHPKRGIARAAPKKKPPEDDTPHEVARKKRAEYHGEAPRAWPEGVRNLYTGAIKKMTMPDESKKEMAQARGSPATDPP
jgi:hypothetical protein